MPARKTTNITEIDRSQPLLHQHGYEIQQFGTLRNLPIALNSNSRSESCDLVNQVLADTIQHEQAHDTTSLAFWHSSHHYCRTI
jgi:starvation-inducible DNA-binding protein